MAKFTKKEKFIAKEMKITPTELRVYENVGKRKLPKGVSAIQTNKAINKLKRKGYITVKRKRRRK